METLLKGQTVLIYEDYMTKQRPEGEAILLKRIPDSRDEQLWQNWQVEFISDGFKCERMVSL